MTEPEELDEDLFADLYEGDDTPAKPAQPAQPAPAAKPQEPEPVQPEPVNAPTQQPVAQEVNVADSRGWEQPNAAGNHGDANMGNGAWNGNGAGNGNQSFDQAAGDQDDNYGPINVKEDGIVHVGVKIAVTRRKTWIGSAVAHYQRYGWPASSGAGSSRHSGFIP
ncbi:hypothetical protein BU24DRAFT_412477 [Aaosphaeria arxii CBS 175.79]|uniref:Uncharacterized protein n=1 Tax=Aaosphaeria arxii CBS 175.79 TaxID=1450172 RepID=A0A6A5XGE2_9PLEO|nr:uncharacterized protein BU24DRAFT_412477 [Aaosphaeria arxii CBS 175.79]KAF2011929.1 hypothetical protein BU24DRAFT_412477 [Aaosphaeria arxii CBS 175.79]